MTGKITTFYSYKGGVGRSFLLANVAVLLAKWGYDVLCIDWDVEAPGLDEYFRPWLGQDAKPGLIEWVSSFARGEPRDWRAHVNHVPLPGATLSLMASGVSDATYASRVQQVDWRELYDRQEFGSYLEQARSEWIDAYDFVLIDSRTGITDIGGVCTVHLPDLLVFLFTANAQSFNGVIQVAQQAQQQRERLPLNRAGLLMLPVASRFDARGQEELAHNWLRIFSERLEPFYDSWLDEAITPRQMIELTRIPYFSVWTFGERLAALEERESDPERISYHCATIAALISHSLGSSELLPTQRDTYVESARKVLASSTSGAFTDPSYAFDFALSYSRENRAFARSLAEQLRSLGYRVWGDSVASGPDWIDTVESALRRSKYLLLLSGLSSSFQLAEVHAFAHQEGGSTERTVFLLQGLHGNDPQLPPWLSSIPNIRVRPVVVAPFGEKASDIAFRAVLHEIGVQSEAAKTSDELTHALNAYMERYVATDHVTDGERRISQKLEIANEVANFVSQHGIERKQLVELIVHDSSPDASRDALIAGLAVVIRNRPEPGDLRTLVLIGARARRLHAAFELLSTIVTHLEAERVTPETRRELFSLLDQYSLLATTRHDTPLLALVDTARKRIANFA